MASTRFLPTSITPRFETTTVNTNDYTHPLDLITDNNSMCTQIAFVPYDFISTFNNSYSLSPGGRSGFIFLPPPKKIVEIPSVTWQQTDVLSTAASMSRTLSAGLGIARGAGAALNQAPNPFLFMLFKHPNFKEYNLSWTVSAENEKETNNIKKILDLIKWYMLPTNFGLTYGYPSVAIIKYTNEEYTHRFLPAVIRAVEVDYSGAGMPSFYQKTNAPTIINFTINMIEIILWDRQKYNEDQRTLYG